MSSVIRSPTQKNIAVAATVLRNSDLVAFPTETVYGLGGNATDDAAVARIFAAKGRPSFNPLIVHFSDVAAAEREVTFTDKAGMLAAAFWPGPLTLVLPRRADSRLSLLVSAGLDTVAVRMPASNIAQALLRAAGVPVAAPSANRSGEVSPTTAQHVEQSLGTAVGMILDGGACAIGIESTVIDMSGETPVILRPGSVLKEQIEAVIGKVTTGGEAGAGNYKSPGMLQSHYAPSLPVRLNVMTPEPGEALIAFGEKVPVGAKRVVNISEAGDTQEAAAKLFATLRVLDSTGYTAIAVMPIPEEGLGIAINDRLRRAAAPR